MYNIVSYISILSSVFYVFQLFLITTTIRLLHARGEKLQRVFLNII